MTTPDTSATSLDSSNEVTLSFHPSYAEYQPGYVILQADDEEKRCFYSNKALLAALSLFFADLPPPSTSDFHGAAPIIPLVGSTSLGLHAFVWAVHSLQASSPFDLLYPPKTHLPDEPQSAIVNAAAIGRRYLVPIIPRLLLGGVRAWAPSPPDPKRMLEFCVWALSDNETMLIAAAESTLGCAISRTPRQLSDAVKRHAPAAWMQLQDLHIRHAEGLGIFRRWTPTWTRRCPSSKCGAYGLSGIPGRLEQAGNVSELQKVADGGYGLNCGQGCLAAAKGFYDDKIAWLSRYTTKFYLDAKDEIFEG